MTQSEKVVSEFCGAWKRGDLDAIAAAFTDDAVYHNVPVAPARGKPAIVELIKGFLAMFGPVDLEIQRSAMGADIVFTERVDRFKVKTHEFALPVCGVFELKHDRIKAWRDYFDLESFNGEMRKAGLPPLT